MLLQGEVIIMIQGPTNYAETVDSVMLYIVAISLVLLLGVTAAMIYFVFKYNRKKNPNPENIHGNVLLEIIWIGIPTLLALSMFYYGYEGFKELRTIPDDAMEVNVTARMWSWEFKYSNGKVTDTLYVPNKKAILLKMVSADVNHSLYIPAFRLKEDVIFGQENYLTFTPEQIGEYDIACAEYCGLNHSMMYTKVKVIAENVFDEWLNSNSQAAKN